MTTQDLISIILPLIIILIMWGMGLSLVPNDFYRVKDSPKQVFWALFVQICISPLLAWGLSVAFKLPTALSAGLILLAATPGGATAVMYSSLARANVAFNVTLTSVNAVIGIFTLPLMTFLIFKYFYQVEQRAPIEVSKVLEVALLMLLPMALGMWINFKKPNLATKINKYVKIASIIFLAILVVFGIVKEWTLISTGLGTVGLAVLLFNLGSLLLGYLCGYFLKLDRANTAAIVFELGVHKAAMAISLAMSPSFFNNIEVAVPSAIYTIIMYITAGVVAYYYARKIQP